MRIGATIFYSRTSIKFYNNLEISFCYPKTIKFIKALLVRLFPLLANAAESASLQNLFRRQFNFVCQAGLPIRVRYRLALPTTSYGTRLPKQLQSFITSITDALCPFNIIISGFFILPNQTIVLSPLQGFCQSTTLIVANTCSIGRIVVVAENTQFCVRRILFGKQSTKLLGTIGQFPY